MCAYVGVLSIISTVDLPTVDANTVEDLHVSSMINSPHSYNSRKQGTPYFHFMNEKVMAQRVQITVDPRFKPRHVEFRVQALNPSPTLPFQC